MSSRPGVVLLLGSALLAAGCDREANAPAQAKGTTPDEVAASSAATAPQAGKFDRSRKGEAAPSAAFIGPDGKPATLADFRGKPVLVNLWATWCAPCVAEMPTLNAAARSLGDRVHVVVVSQDLDESPDKVRTFLADRKLDALQPYRDPQLALGAAYGVNLPATILYDAQGREVWRRLGAFEWDSAEAGKAIAEAS